MINHEFYHHSKTSLELKLKINSIFLFKEKEKKNIYIIIRK